MLAGATGALYLATFCALSIAVGACIYNLFGHVAAYLDLQQRLNAKPKVGWRRGRYHHNSIWDSCVLAASRYIAVHILCCAARAPTGCSTHALALLTLPKPLVLAATHATGVNTPPAVAGSSPGVLDLWRTASAPGSGGCRACTLVLLVTAQVLRPRHPQQQTPLTSILATPHMSLTHVLHVCLHPLVPQERSVLHGVDVTGSNWLQDPAVLDALEFAAAAHAGQTRKTGEPYVAHCIEAALIVEKNLPRSANWRGQGERERHRAAVIATLLHDVLDDTPVQPEEVVARFGPHVGRMVEQVSKLSQVNQMLRRDKRKVRGGEEQGCDVVCASNRIRRVLHYCHDSAAPV